MIIQIYFLVKFEKSYKNYIKSLVRRDYIYKNYKFIHKLLIIYRLLLYYFIILIIKMRIANKKK